MNFRVVHSNGEEGTTFKDVPCFGNFLYHLSSKLISETLFVNGKQPLFGLNELRMMSHFRV